MLRKSDVPESASSILVLVFLAGFAPSQEPAPPKGPVEAPVAAALDSFHDAAAKADAEGRTHVEWARRHSARLVSSKGDYKSLMQALGMIEAAEQIGLRAPAWCYEHANPSWVDHLAASFLGRLYPRGEGRFGGPL